MATNYPSSSETTNFARLSRLVIDICSDLLRSVLKVTLPPPGLTAILQSQRVHLYKNLERHQQQILYPSGGVFTGALGDLDFTLLYRLIRNIQGINILPHQKGWGRTPDNADRSLSANIDRLRVQRNEAYGHLPTASLSDADFNGRWAIIRQSVLEIETGTLTGDVFITAVDALLTMSMDPDTEKSYIQELEKQYNAELEVKAIVQEIKVKQGDMATDISDVATRQGAMATNISDVATRHGAMATNISDVATRQGAMATNISDVATRQGAMATNISDVATRQGAMATNISDVATRQGAMATNISDVATRQGAMATNISDVATRQGAMATNISDVATRQGAMATNISDVATRQGAMATDISDVATRQGAMATNISDVATRQGIIKDDVTAVKDKLDVLATNTSRKKELSPKIEAMIVSNCSYRNNSSHDQRRKQEEVHCHQRFL
ncbi:uncharacterized protein LOC110458272 isoform X2 [Mizuhopecten yessoensis]|uniref:uncharacterized protein LOC110458272 isoform X2 n=1 Tax=Mizuhopecten yessoensis TaxID=6573 RepID=UPI000B45DB92|nr:uncharacterized protein LOC110458272 isoform X2 [Mizuhopecten yessoensis]